MIFDNPPVFVLVDQNFPPWVPVGGEGECLKIIQVENGSLTELVEIFLGLTRGFDVPAGAVVLLSSPTHAAAIGTADIPPSSFGPLVVSGGPSWVVLRFCTGSPS